MGWLRTMVVAAGLALATVSCAGVFTRISPERFEGVPLYEYTGTVHWSDEFQFRTLMEKENKIQLLINSPGGDLYAGLDLGRAIAKNKDKVQIVIGQAYSAAALISIADDDEIFLDDESFLAWHLPFIPGDDPTDSDKERVLLPASWMTVGKDMYSYMNDYMTDRKELNKLWNEMVYLQEVHGTQAFYVWKKDGSKGYILPKKEDDEDKTMPLFSILGIKD